MAEWIGIGRRARRCYGFDEVALAPGKVTINPEEVEISWKLADKEFPVPIIAAAMDGVVDVKFAVEMSKLGGMAVLNLDGVQTRYDNPNEVLDEIANADPKESTNLIQKIYTTPIKENLVAKRVEEIKKSGGYAAVSCIPNNAAKFGPIAQEAGVDCFIVQATVISTNHVATKYKSLNLSEFCSKIMKVPVILGNCVTYEVATELLETGCSGILVGVGPGAACTTRGVLGIGVPQVTSTIDCANARDIYFQKTGRYVSIITDGGMRRGGDVCKAFASGADAVMVGSTFAKTSEAPGRGFHWGMATSHSNLPRGTRIKVGITGTVEQILFGPAVVDDGSQNLMGALATSMGSLGAKTIKDMHYTEMIIAPSIQTEGKLFQATQNVGMCK
ncbi:MAG: GuaB3 family IMP dehydrogenase-related protein [Candidatus Omnitrophica bacterium]|jgi:IMP dehydrogenase|nr:GuaB3 family IMP dehydrogenase-related protein [Candidatus Omnitrophota bacterium]